MQYKIRFQTFRVPVRCPWCWKSTDTGTGQRNQSAQRVRITAPVGLWSDYRLFVFPSDYNVLGNHFISPPRVRHCPLVSTNTLSNDVSFFTSHQPQSHKFLPSVLTESLFVCMQRSSASGGGMHAYWQWGVKIYPNNAHSPACSKTSRRFVCICLLTHPSIRMILREGSFSRIYSSDGLDCPVFQQNMDMCSLLQGETEKPRKLDIWFAAPGKALAQEWELFLRERKK